MSWSASLLRMKPPCVVKPLHLCSPKAPRSRKRRRDTCFHNLNGYVPKTSTDANGIIFKISFAIAEDLHQNVVALHAANVSVNRFLDTFGPKIMRHPPRHIVAHRSEAHTSELQPLNK